METKEWCFMDKAKWPRGPWDGEPDKMQFTDPITGLPALIVRNNVGALCGYVGVSEDHPLYGIDYNSCSLPTAVLRGKRPEDEGGSKGPFSLPIIPERFMKRLYERRVCGDSYCEHTPESLLDVHGGITFSDFCQELGEKGEGVCHVPGANEPEKVWWFGFDCSHLHDRSPALERLSKFFSDEQYKDIDYVKAEIFELAKQLLDLGKKGPSS